MASEEVPGTKLFRYVAKCVVRTTTILYGVLPGRWSHQLASNSLFWSIRDVEDGLKFEQADSLTRHELLSVALIPSDEQMSIGPGTCSTAEKSCSGTLNIFSRRPHPSTDELEEITAASRKLDLGNKHGEMWNIGERLSQGDVSRAQEHTLSDHRGRGSGCDQS